MMKGFPGGALVIGMGPSAPARLAEGSLSRSRCSMNAIAAQNASETPLRTSCSLRPRCPKIIGLRFVFQKPSCLIRPLSHLCQNGCSGSESILGRSVSRRVASSRAWLEQACQIGLMPPHTLSLTHTSLQASPGPPLRETACQEAGSSLLTPDSPLGPGRTSYDSPGL